MAFPPGHKKPAGSGIKKGQKHKRTLAFAEAMERHDYDVVEALIWSCKESKDQYLFYKERVENGRFSPIEDQSAKFLGLHIQTLKEIASYLYSKPKTIELTTGNEQSGFKIVVEDYIAKKESESGD